MGQQDRSVGLMRAGSAVEPLLRLLQLGSDHEGAHHAVAALAGLTASRAAAEDVAARGGAASLLRVLEDGWPAKAVQHALIAVGNLAACAAGREAIGRAGGTDAIVGTLQSADVSTEMASEAARALANMALASSTSAKMHITTSETTPLKARAEASNNAAHDFSFDSPTTALDFPDSPTMSPASAPATPERGVAQERRKTPRSRDGSQLYSTPVRRAVHPSPWTPSGTSSRPSSSTPTASRATGSQVQRAVAAMSWSPTRRAMRTVSPSKAYLRPASSETLGDWPQRGATSPLRRSTGGGGTQRSPRWSSTRGSQGEARASSARCLTPPRPQRRERRGDMPPVEELVKCLRTNGLRGWRQPLWAAGIIASLQLTKQEKDAFREAGAIPCLVNLLEVGPEMEVCRLACAALSQLAYGHPPNCAAIRAEGGLEALAQVLAQARHYGEVAHWASCALTQLTFKQAESCAVLLAAGAVPSLISVVRHQREEETRANALRVLCNMAHQQEACAEIRCANGLPIIVSQLNSGFGSQSTAIAARTLLNMTCNDDQPDAILEAGGVQGLAKLLAADPQADITMVACLALTQLALRSERASAAVAESRGVDRLLRLLRPGPSQDITRVALGTLLNLSNHTKNCDAVREAGGIPELVRLLTSTKADASTQLQAARVLSNLALNQQNSDAIRVAGGVQAFVSLLSGPPDNDIVRVAAVALSQLSFESPANKAAIHESDGIPPLVRLLGSDRPDTVKWAACALAELAFNSNANAAAIRSAGGVRQMVGLLKGGAHLDVAVQAVRGLANLALNPGNQDDIREQGAIPNIIALLQHKDADDNAMVVAACALAEMAFGNTRNCNAIYEAGGLEQLLRIASTRTEGPILWQVVRAVAELSAEDYGAARSAVAAYETKTGAFSKLAAVERSYPEVAAQARRVLAHLSEAGSPVPSPPRYFSTPPSTISPAQESQYDMPLPTATSSYSHWAEHKAEYTHTTREGRYKDVARTLDYEPAASYLNSTSNSHPSPGLVPYQSRSSPAKP